MTMRLIWLQELRDLLYIPSYEDRRRAMLTWERRWLIDLHARYIVTEEELVTSKTNPLLYVRNRIADSLGRKLADMMVEMSCEDRHRSDDDGWMGVEVRGDVMAIRQELDESH